MFQKKAQHSDRNPPSSHTSLLRDSQQENRHQLRRLLRAWHDPTAFQAHEWTTSALVQQAGYAQGAPAESVLRRLLQACIARLRPSTGSPDRQDPRWRPYLALVGHYIEGRSIEALSREMHISAPSCRRAIERALDALLGYLQEAEQRTLHQISLTASPTLPTRPPINTAPLHHEPLIGRDALIERLEALVAFGCRRIALYGLPGVGKTALLTHLAHSGVVQNQYPEGVLWATVGMKPKPLSILNEWGLALGVSSSELAQANTPEVRARLLRGLLQHRRMLFVLNDVWRAEDLRHLLLGGASCGYVFSTRSQQLAVHLADPQGCFKVPELSLDDSAKLLQFLAPRFAERYPEHIAQLASASGGLPLTLSLIGHALREASHADQDRRMQAAFARLSDAHTRLHLRRATSEADATQGGAPSLSENLALSVSLLTPAQQRALFALSALPPKPATFDEQTAEAVLAVVTSEKRARLNLLDALVDAGLIDHESGRYGVHPSIVDWCEAQRGARARWRRVARRALAQHVGAHFQLPLDAAQRAIAQAAVQAALDLGLAPIAATLAEKFFEEMERCGMTSFIEALIQLAEGQLADDPMRLAVLRGRLLLQRGDVPAAIAHLEQSIARARQTAPGLMPAALAYLAQAYLRDGQPLSTISACDEAAQCASPHDSILPEVLITRALACSQVADFSSAKASLQRALALAREQHRVEMEIAAMIYLAMLHYQTGRYAEAEPLLSTSLSLAQPLHLHEHVAEALLTLGLLRVEQGRRAEAVQLCAQALPLVKRINRPVQRALAEYLLGLLHLRREEWASAEAHFAEVLRTAEAHHLSWVAAAIHAQLGECHLAEGRLTDAEQRFTHSLACATHWQYAALQAVCEFGLARLRAAQGAFHAAREMGTHALRRLRDMQHYRADEVARWLAQLPDVTS